MTMLSLWIPHKMAPTSHSCCNCLEVCLDLQNQTLKSHSLLDLNICMVMIMYKSCKNTFIDPPILVHMHWGEFCHDSSVIQVNLMVLDGPCNWEEVEEDHRSSYQIGATVTSLTISFSSAFSSFVLGSSFISNDAFSYQQLVWWVKW